ncbi:MAG: (2Fe-2S)-binding protein [Chitinophagaceae bacterium]|nr:MAG: (2Fe-2S)-binding protein [Chitinophagaceae bacterium]
MTSTFLLTVNEKKYEIQAEASTPLLYILRNNIGLNGPKFGCGLQQCGACMVLLNGEAQPSCMVPVSVVADKMITTLEGLAEKGKLHPLQQAFIDEQAAQCGFCMNGMVISGVSLLNKNKNPDNVEIRESLQRCLCRCGTQSRVMRAVKKASKNI